MASFTKGGAALTPFGANEYLRSTRNKKTESYILAASTVPARTIDGVAGQKILKRGTVLAKITSGGDAGKVGPYQSGNLSDEVQTLTFSGSPTGGSFKLSFGGQETNALPFNANGGTIGNELLGLSTVGAGNLLVSGGGPFTVTFKGALAKTNVPQIVLSNNSLTGGSSPTIVIATTTQGGPDGAGDGRGEPQNIVGLSDTFLPWQTMERDVEIAATYECTAVQGWCIELDVAGNEIALTNATRDAMRSGNVGVEIMFH